ncbi:major facilitator superfamily protein [Tieghemostelium lacteum]|uniref:Major facilitator superfamily protein n=1 Tax=Tieghemostelium lacteum TaxID=361077 RepID=A0A151ZHE3_TIELA|nr:major facilitator superfamily protein [Tieghemostelium lacteum]|eukprot:KYQ93386.1 major facilitator superfamily protein [Tieghemostelium lacteum]
MGKNEIVDQNQNPKIYVFTADGISSDQEIISDNPVVDNCNNIVDENHQINSTDINSPSCISTSSSISDKNESVLQSSVSTPCPNNTHKPNLKNIEKVIEILNQEKSQEISIVNLDDLIDIPITPRSMAAVPSIGQLDEMVSNVDSSSSPPSRTSTFLTDEDQSTQTREPLKRKQILIIFSGLMISLFLSALDTTIVATALPAIVADMGRLEQLSWVVTVYLLTSTSVAPLFGKFSDIFGRKPMLLFSLSVFLIGSILCATSYSLLMLIASRAVQGIGGGGLMSAVMIVMAEIVPLRERGKYQGLLGAVYAVSSVVGPLIGGTFTDRLNWRWAFWINLPIGAVALIVVFFALKLPQDTLPFKEGVKRIDAIGTLTLVSAVVSFLLAMSWGGETYQWDSPIVISLFSASILLLSIFIIAEKFLTKNPIIPLVLFKNRNYVLCSMGSFLLGFIMFGVIYYIPLYFQMVKNETATYSGLQLLPTMLFIVICGSISGILITKFGHYKTYPILGMLMMTVGCFLLTLWNDQSKQIHYIAYQSIIGMGIGFTMQILVLVAQNSVEYSLISISTATISFWRTIGGVISVSLFNTILNQQFQSNLRQLLRLYPDILNGMPSDQFQADFITTFEGYGKEQIVDAYASALSIVFLSATPFAALGCIVILFIKPTKLRTTLFKKESQPTQESVDIDQQTNESNNTNRNNENSQLEIDIIEEETKTKGDDDIDEIIQLTPHQNNLIIHDQKEISST